MPVHCAQAKVADFGLLREVEESAVSLNSTLVVGTPGYVDPAYVRSRFVTPAADVYRWVPRGTVPVLRHL